MSYEPELWRPEKPLRTHHPRLPSDRCRQCGTLWTEENTYINPKGCKVCRACLREHPRQHCRREVSTQQGEPIHPLVVACDCEPGSDRMCVECSAIWNEALLAPEEESYVIAAE
jgi:hypothetical protein